MFVGLDNYVKLFTRPEYSVRFFGALKNNLIFFVFDHIPEFCRCGTDRIC